MILFIPIKKESQRVPLKNFRKFNGIPLYKHCLYKLDKFEVFVDTDSEEIINECIVDQNLNHVTAFKRKDSLVGHDISVCDLISNFIRRHNIVDKAICQVHVTSPFLKTEALDLASSKLNEGYDSVVSCNEYKNRLWRKESYGYCPINHNPLRLEQTQDLPCYFEENSLFYIFNSSHFLKTNTRIGVNPFFYICNYPENVDIDTEDDWDLVKTLEGKL